MKAYSKELRGEVLAAWDAGAGTCKVATRFRVSESWVPRIKQDRREKNKLGPAMTRRRTPKWTPLADRIRKLIRQRADVAQQRSALQVLQSRLVPDRLVYIDDTWAKTNMTRPRGRAPAGERLLASVPHGHWKVTTFLAALRSSGLTAPLVVDGAINGGIFLSWVQQQFVPTLREGDIVVMDNFSAHKVAGVRQAIAAVGARVMYLPPYSPVFTDFVPYWALRLRCVREVQMAAKSASARSVDALWNLCGTLLDAFTEHECRNCFKHCGCRYT